MSDNLSMSVRWSTRENIRDITNQVDRLESWIRAFLIRSRNDPGSLSDQARIALVVRTCLENFEPQMRKRGIRTEIRGSTVGGIVKAQAAELEQASAQLVGFWVNHLIVEGSPKESLVKILARGSAHVSKRCN